MVDMSLSLKKTLFKLFLSFIVLLAVYLCRVDIVEFILKEVISLLLNRLLLKIWKNYFEKAEDYGGVGKH